MSWVKGYATIVAKRVMAYRFELMVWSVLLPFNLMIFWFLWSTLYATTGQEVIRGYTLFEMMQYFIVAEVVAVLVSSNADNMLAKKIRSGDLVVDLVRPLQYLKGVMVGWFSDNAVAVIIICTPLIFIGVTLFDLSFQNPIHFGLSILSVLLGILLSIFFVMFIATSAFWMTKYTGISSLRNGLAMFFGGAFLPLTFFPATIQTISKFIPLQYMYFIPTQVIIGRYETIEVLRLAGIQIIWIAIFFVLVHLAWNKGIKKFTAAGG